MWSYLLLVLFQSQKLNQDLKQANKRLQSASPIVIDESSGKLASINRKPDETRRRIEIRFIPPGQSK